MPEDHGSNWPQPHKSLASTGGRGPTERIRRAEIAQALNAEGYLGTLALKRSPENLSNLPSPRAMFAGICCVWLSFLSPGRNSHPASQLSLRCRRGSFCNLSLLGLPLRRSSGQNVEPEANSCKHQCKAVHIYARCGGG